MERFKKAITSIVLAVVMTATTVGSSIAAMSPVQVMAATTFKDVSSSNYYYPAVNWGANTMGIILGYSDGTFKPNNSLTRAEFMIMLWKLAGKPGISSSAPTFKDISGQTANVQKAIRWGASKGIIAGFSDGTFRPTTNVTREQLAMMVWRYAGKPSIDVNTYGYQMINADVYTSRNTYKQIFWALQFNLMKGSLTSTSKGGKYNFNPTSACSRGDAVYALYILKTQYEQRGTKVSLQNVTNEYVATHFCTDISNDVDGILNSSFSTTKSRANSLRSLLTSNGITNGMNAETAFRKIVALVASKLYYDTALTYTKNTTYWYCIFNGKAICSGYSSAVKALCDLCGLECEMVYGHAYSQSGAWCEHEWNDIYLNGSWYFSDVTFYDNRGNSKYILNGSSTFGGDGRSTETYSDTLQFFYTSD